ncbi:hypothetical protein HGRIS_002458 [Hohenbuehelia grisea]|uniref:Smr domain-containing protein n=1 Tax=Hohenbuehelia grisea TaxID=104357 RepID=A0ABR3JL77_9AGAR
MDIFIPVVSGAALCLLPNSALDVNAKPAWVLLGLWDGYSLQRLTASSHLPVIIYGAFYFLDFYLAHSFAKTVTVVLWMVLGVVLAETFGPITWHTPQRSQRVHVVRVGRTIPTATAAARTTRPAVPGGRQITFAETHRTREFLVETSATTSITNSVSSSPSSGGSITETPVLPLPTLQSIDYSPRPSSSRPIPGGYTSHTPQDSSDPTSHLPSPPTTFTLQSPDDPRPSVFQPLHVVPTIILPASHQYPTNGSDALLPQPSPAINVQIASTASTPSNDSMADIQLQPPPPILSLLSPLDITPDDPSAPPDDPAEEVKIVPPPSSMMALAYENTESIVDLDMEAAAKRSRQAGKAALKSFLALKSEHAAARETRDLKRALTVKARMDKLEREALKEHDSADDLYYIIDNPNQDPNRIDVHRLTTRGAVKLLNEALSYFVSEGSTSLEFVVGSTLHGRTVKAALIDVLQEQKIPFTDHDPSVLVITEIH